jgi:hypothetical protein
MTTLNSKKQIAFDDFIFEEKSIKEFHNFDPEYVKWFFDKHLGTSRKVADENNNDNIYELIDMIIQSSKKIGSIVDENNDTTHTAYKISKNKIFIHSKSGFNGQISDYDMLTM